MVLHYEEREMNFYPFHIGDYISDTAHLTRIEDLVYRRLIDLYCLTEKPLSSDVTHLARLVRMKGCEEELKDILAEFFDFTGDEKSGFWKHKRCEKEIKIFREIKRKNSKAGKASGISRRKSSIIKRQQNEQVFNERSTSVKQPLPLRSTPNTITNTNINKKENTKEKSSSPLARLVSLKINSEIAKDWIQLRNRIKAPVTATVIKSFQKESEKAKMSLEEVLKVCIENSWRGFKAEWMDSKTLSNAPSGNKNPHGILTHSGEKIVDWRASEAGINAKGKELCIPKLENEYFLDYRDRIFNKIKENKYV